MRRLLMTAGIVATLGGNALASTFTAYETGSTSLSTLPGDNTWYVLYSIDVSSVNSNDILMVSGEGQLTRDGNNAQTLLSSQLLLGNTATATTGTALDEANGINIKDDLAIGLAVKLAIKKFPSGSSSHYVNLIVHSNGSDFDVGSGKLQVLKISP